MLLERRHTLGAEHRDRVVFAAAAAVRELHVALRISCDAFRDNPWTNRGARANELLRLPSLRVVELFVASDFHQDQAVEVRPTLRPFAAVLRAHAATLRDLRVRLSIDPAPPGAEVDDFADALAGCTSLETLTLTSLLEPAAFDVVAAAAARG